MSENSPEPGLFDLGSHHPPVELGLTKPAFRALPRIRLQDSTLSRIAGGASLADVLDMLCLFIEDLMSTPLAPPQGEAAPRTAPAGQGAREQA